MVIIRYNGKHKTDQNCADLVYNTEIYNNWTEYTETINMDAKVIKLLKNSEIMYPNILKHRSSLDTVSPLNALQLLVQ